MADIFICHAREDLQAVSSWVKRLEAHGFPVWMDLQSVDGATLWAKVIVEAIDACQIVIVMLSKASVASDNVAREVSLAREKGKTILPLKLEPVDVPSSLQHHLGDLECLELFDGVEDQLFQTIVSVLRNEGVEAAGPSRGALASAAVLGAVRRNTKRLAGVLGALAVVAILLVVWALWPAAPAPGLEDAALKLAAPTINVRWVKKGFLGPEEGTVVGTAGVFDVAGGKLILITNSACLDLRGLGKSPRIRTCEIWVDFPSGESKVVERFSDKVGGLDLAAIEVSGEGLNPGEDYILLPFRKDVAIAEGDRLVVVKGSVDPSNPGSVRTSQKISAIAPPSTTSAQCRVIRSDADVTNENRGGLLLKEHRGKFFWVGIGLVAVTPPPDGQKEPNVSVYAGDVLSLQPKWFPCTPAGAADALNQIYGADARVAN